MDEPYGVIPDEHDKNLDPLKSFITFMSRQMLRANVLMTVNAILMGVMVGIGAYGHRYRHHPLTRFFFIGATTLFLPIVSYIVSITGGEFTIAVKAAEVLATGDCMSNNHMLLVLLWTSFIQIIGINTTAIVAADDREARTIAPPTALLVQAVWITYLGATFIAGKGYWSYDIYILSFTSSALIFIKIFFKYYAWYSARQSFSFGRNPRLVTGYMTENLRTDDYQHAADEQHVPPPLLVSRENTMVVGKNPHGYQIMSSSSSGISTGYRRLSTTNKQRGYLVTIDKVWELDDRLLKSTAQLKDVCLSFALFKMLRCHFARCNVTESAGFIKARDFLWHLLLEDRDGTRTLGVIATELSFLQDYYYSSLPTSYSKDWLPISSIFISLGSIGYGLFIACKIMPEISYYLRGSQQIFCLVKISNNRSESKYRVEFGSMWYDFIPLALVVLLAVLSEVRDIASYVCSDWTKVALMCRFVSWHEHPTLRRCIGILLRPRCKLVRPLMDNMNQCSIIVLHPTKFRKGALLRRIIPLPEPKKSVKVPREVKAAIVNTLRSSSSGRGDDLRNGKLCWQQLGIQFGNNFIQARGTQGTSDTLLAWHIATTIFEARNPPSLSSSSGSVARHLSRYCVYLLAYSPQLLPDDENWSKNMYKATKKGAESALRNTVPMATPELEYQQLVRLLSPARSKHDVLNEGARLGEQLVELMKGEEEGAGWKALGGFWCDMILHMAPSDNLNGHAVALAQGGELITLLWALLTHVAIPEATVSTTTMGASPHVV